MINSTLVSFLTLPEALIRLSMDYIVDVFNTDVKLPSRASSKATISIYRTEVLTFTEDTTNV